MTTEAHPLFLNENDEDPPEVGFIHIVRYDGPFSANRKIQVPKQFAAEELTDLEQIYELYGGGNYELIGRDYANQRITKRVRITLPGSPKPIVIDTQGEEVEDEEEENKSVKTGMVPPPPGLDMTGILGMLMHSSTMQMQMMQQMAEQRSKDQSEQTKMQIAQMQESNRMMMQMMMMNQNKPADNTMAPIIDLLSKMVVGGASKGSSFSELLNAIKFGSDLKGNTEAAKDETDWESTIGTFLKAFQSAQGGGVPGFPLPPGMQFPPGFIPQGVMPPHMQPQQQPPMRRRVVDIHQGRVVPQQQEQPPPMEPAGPPPNDDKKVG
jgi:hypothetical protein